MIQPITPKEVTKTKATMMPDGVIQSWNECIAANYQYGESVVTQTQIVLDICSNMGCTSDVVYANHWLDIEDIYREQGWAVVYDKPAYNESYEATFTFTAKG